jgi:NitT/TauT family transport system substrate-binding protein
MTVTSTTRRKLLAGAAGLGAAAALGAPAIAQAPVRVRIMMDWAWQGPHAFALCALYKGYFREEGVDVQLERGFGSGRVPVELAGGAYQMGVADINPAIRFVAERPQTGILGVGMLFHASPLACVVRADGPIRTPKDLEGRTLAAPEVDAGRQLFPAFARANGIDVARVTFQTVSGELREPMLVQRRVDGITGFLTTSVPALTALGLGPEAQRTFRYRDHGTPFYSNAVLTTRAFAQANPAAVKGVVRAMFRGMRDGVRNPAEAMDLLKRHEPLTDVPVERARWELTIRELIDTPEVRAGGLGNMDMPRLQRTIEMVEESYNLPKRLQASDVYSADFLPRREDGMVF